jgi:hypothetical protein
VPEGAVVPPAVVAVTDTVYATSLVRFVIVQLVAPVVVQVRVGCSAAVADAV